MIVLAAVAGGAAWFLLRAPTLDAEAATASLTPTDEHGMAEEVVDVRSTAQQTSVPRRAKPCAGCPGKQGKTEPGADPAVATVPPWRPIEPVVERVLGHAADAALPVSTRTTLQILKIPETGHGFVVTSWGQPGTQQDWRLGDEEAGSASAVIRVASEPADPAELWVEVGSHLRQLVRLLQGQAWELDETREGYRLVALPDAAAIFARETSSADGWERVRLELDPQGRIIRASWAQWDPVQQRAWRCLVSLETGPSLEQRPAE